MSVSLTNLAFEKINKEGGGYIALRGYTTKFEVDKLEIAKGKPGVVKATRGGDWYMYFDTSDLLYFSVSEIEEPKDEETEED